jgi:prepilin peptidase CpaA
MPGGGFLEAIMPTEAYLQAALFLLVILAAVNDLATRRIPNRLLLAGLACALLLHVFSAVPGKSLLIALSGMGVGLAVFLPLYLLRGMAAGDVKMMAVVGAFVRPVDVFEIVVVTWLAGGLMGLLIVLLNGRLRLAFDNLGRMLRGAMLSGTGITASAGQASAGSMPYGLAIAFGTIVFLVRHQG